MIIATAQQPRPPLRSRIDRAPAVDEAQVVGDLLAALDLPKDSHARIFQRAHALVTAARAGRSRIGGIDAFLREYGLSTQEGVLLMCVAEALLRIPDDPTRERLIRDKLSIADWETHLGRSDSLLVNASTWALMLTGRIINVREETGSSPWEAFRRLVTRLGEPVVRQAVWHGMRVLGWQFVMGQTIEDALARARSREARGYTYSFDMLGEAARTTPTAQRYQRAYESAITAIARTVNAHSVRDAPSISVKLSALHPRFEASQRDRLRQQLVPALTELARQAARAGIGLSVDAEEAERLDITLDVIEAVSADPALADWPGLGVVVQSYQKAAPAVIDWLADLARRHRRRLMVRLVKGAYWDSEIKRAQELGLRGYPVFTRKTNTDVSYLACARRLLANPEAFYPQFATHNAQTIASVLELAGETRDLEFQRLHGMGEALFDHLLASEPKRLRCRIYAPVGDHKELLAYLVRRLLENGANSSFVNRLQDDRLAIEDIIADPAAKVRALPCVPHPRIPLPRNLYLPERLNARGTDLANPSEVTGLAMSLAAEDRSDWTAGPIIGGKEFTSAGTARYTPADTLRIAGYVQDATPALAEDALKIAAAAAPSWANTPVDVRALCLERAANLLEDDMPALLALGVREAGKTVADAIAEVREAADYCRYYAHRARTELCRPLPLAWPGSGARAATLRGGGVVACISPWNFPLAIFLGQVTAALVSGNAVVAKPAEQTPLMAAAAVHLLLRAGIPPDVLHLLPGDGVKIGSFLVADPRVSAVLFTGSDEVALGINRRLAVRSNGCATAGLAPLIAETGGQNAMIVDSTALPEQVVRDALMSAFLSAGQRCSALRVLFLQDDIAEPIIGMLADAMDELRLGNPYLLSTDIGPVIDANAQSMLEGHATALAQAGMLVRRVTPSAECARGTFVAPALFEIDTLARLQTEVFGPMLHVVRYGADRLNDVIDAINTAGFGLTLGIQSRIDGTWRSIAEQARIGNIYVNRNQVGAVVGVQPFGGQGRSGTGPKAGGPHYLHRLVVEQPILVENATSRPEPMASSSGSDLLPAERSRFETPCFDRDALDNALAAARSDGPGWARTPEGTRAQILEVAADRLDALGGEIIASCAGWVVVDMDGDGVSRAADYLRFCAARARSSLMLQYLPGPTGERNELSFQPRGTMLCLAIGDSSLAALVGPLAAALAAGNAVVFWHRVKPLARLMQALLRESGIPTGAIALLSENTGATGTGPTTSLQDLLFEPTIAGVAIAGCEADAAAIGRILAEREGAILPLIWHHGPAEEALLGSPLMASPHYLERYVSERTLTVNTTAAGGNASLISLTSEV